MQDKTCSQCGTVCRSTARFCNRCSHPLTAPNSSRTCAKGHRQDPSWQECPFCKEPTSVSPLINPAPTKNPSRTPPTMVELNKDSAQHASAQTGRSKGPSHTVVALGSDKHATQLVEEKKPAPKLQTRSDRPATEVDEHGVMRVRGSRTMVMRDPSPAPRPANPSLQKRHPSQAGPIRGVMVTYSLNPNGKPFLIRDGRQLLGSLTQAQIYIKHPSISEKHAIITASSDGIFIDDCLSTNGTLVNDQPVQDKCRLEHGDLIQTGGVLWRFAKIDMPPEPKI